MTNRLPSRGAVWCLLLLFTIYTSRLLGAEPAAIDERSFAPLGPGDTIAVKVYGQADMDSTEYIGDDGTVRLPLVGPVHVAGLSPVDAAAQIAAALKNGQYLVDPHVTVTVVLSRSQRVSVLGEVKNPGRYPLDPRTSALDLLAQAGGLTETAAEVAYIVRTDAAGRETRQPFSTRVTSGAGTGIPSAARLESGDSIYVPRADRYYIYGEVNTPNMYPVESGMTVIEAIVRAGGVSPRGSERRVEIKRKDSNGTVKIIHAKPGDLVQAGDVIRVKESIF